MNREKHEWGAGEVRTMETEWKMSELLHCRGIAAQLLE